MLRRELHGRAQLSKHQTTFDNNSLRARTCEFTDMVRARAAGENEPLWVSTLHGDIWSHPAPTHFLRLVDDSQVGGGIAPVLERVFWRGSCFVLWTRRQMAWAPWTPSHFAITDSWGRPPRSGQESMGPVPSNRSAQNCVKWATAPHNPPHLHSSHPSSSRTDEHRFISCGRSQNRL